MSNIKISSLLKDQILSGSCKFIKNGNLFFDSLLISNKKLGFYNGSFLIGELKFPNNVNFEKRDTITVKLSKAYLEVELKND